MLVSMSVRVRAQMPAGSVQVIVIFQCSDCANLYVLRKITIKQLKTVESREEADTPPTA